MRTLPAATHGLATTENDPLGVAALPQNREILTAEIVPAAISPSNQAPLQLSPPIARLLNNRLAVIALLAVAGPVGLPALWFSGRFGRWTKIITTLIFVLITVAFPLAITYYFCEIALRPLVDAFTEAGV